ncbi:hypothetical protein ACFW04_006593 [Cataglyphis niger]
MSIQDPREDPSLMPKLPASNITILQDMQISNDEDRLDCIASSFPPFPIEFSDSMETEIESANDVASNFQPNPSTLTKALSPKKVCDINDLLFLSETKKYDRTSQGPFDVVIQSSKNSASLIDPIAVNILEIKKIGFSKINIQLKSRKATNNLIKKGIIRNVPLTSDEDIRRVIDSDIVVGSVKKLNRKRRNTDASPSSCCEDQESDFISCRTILITFKGLLPRHPCARASPVVSTVERGLMEILS